jgi:serine protease Do
MFAMNGEVIGIVSHNISKSGGSEGLGFVVTINTAKKLLLEKRSFWSGLEGQVLSDAQADLLNLPPGSTGFVVKTVAKDSPADKMGLRGATMIANLAGDQIPLGGDIILTVEGIKAEAVNLATIRDQLASKSPGSPFKVTVLRAGRVLELTGRVQ